MGDTASGMRVVRRDRLEQIYPLPDGLHFTPAMSARVLLRDHLKLVELPMAYQERVGRSKLSVVGDGLRFLMVILRAAVTYRPARLLLFVSSLLALGVVAVAFEPSFHWLREGRLDEWEIYRILLASLLATMSATFVCGAVVSDRIAATAQGREPDRGGLTGVVARLFTPRMRLVGGTTLLALAFLVVSPGIFEFVTSGTVEMHWSRAMLGSLFVVLACSLAVTTFLLNMLNLIDADGRVSLGQRPPDRIHAPPSRDAGVE